MSETINIEEEVQARVDFKLKELVNAMKQAAARNWHIASQTGKPKYQHYWEAFEEMTKMLEKERTMAVPYNEMAIRKRIEARDLAVNVIVKLIIKRGEHPKNEYHITRNIVAAVEKAQSYNKI